jgi:hypothetical protein
MLLHGRLGGKSTKIRNRMCGGFLGLYNMPPCASFGEPWFVFDSFCCWWEYTLSVGATTFMEPVVCLITSHVRVRFDCTKACSLLPAPSSWADRNGYGT